MLDCLLHLPYAYNDRSIGMNCYGLAQHVRSHFNAPPLPDFSHHLLDYPTEDSLPPNFMLDVLRSHCEERSDSAAQHLDLLALRFYGKIALGTVIAHEGDRFVVFMRRERDGGGVSAVETIDRFGRAIESVWVYASKND